MHARSLHLAMVCALAWCTAVTTQALAQQPIPTLADPPPLEAAAEPRESTVVPLRYVPVRDVAQLLGQLLEDEELRIVPEMINNSLIISGSRSAMERAAATIRIIDRAPARVHVEVLIAESDAPPAEDNEAHTEGMSDAELTAFLKAGGLKITRRVKLSTINNQATQVQFGSRKPVVVGTQQSGRGFSTSRAQLEDHGLIVSLTPRVSPGAPVLMEFSFELSRLEAPQADGEEAPGRPDTTTVTMQTTLSVEDGQTAVAGRQTTRSTDGHRDFVVLVRVNVDRGD